MRFLRTRRWTVDFFLYENSFCHCYLMCKAYVASFFDSCFLLFLFCTYLPCILVLVFTSLCLAPLDSIKISGFLFSCRVAEWASLLLNLAAYALAGHIWISISALPWLSEHGLYHLKQSAMPWMISLCEFELTLLMYHHAQPPEAITVCIVWG